MSDVDSVYIIFTYPYKYVLGKIVINIPIVGTRALPNQYPLYYEGSNKGELER